MSRRSLFTYDDLLAIVMALLLLAALRPVAPVSVAPDRVQVAAQ